MAALKEWPVACHVIGCDAAGPAGLAPFAQELVQQAELLAALDLSQLG